MPQFSSADVREFEPDPPNPAKPEPPLGPLQACRARFTIVGPHADPRVGKIFEYDAEGSQKFVGYTKSYWDSALSSRVT